MEIVELPDVAVLDQDVSTVLCLIGGRRVSVPSLLVQSGTTVQHRGDRGMLVIPRWLGIGLGLVWPFAAGVPVAEGGTVGRERTAHQADGCDALGLNPPAPRRRPPHRVPRRSSKQAVIAGGGSS
jgi:hypothetical protein